MVTIIERLLVISGIDTVVRHAVAVPWLARIDEQMLAPADAHNACQVIKQPKQYSIATITVAQSVGVPYGAPVAKHQGEAGDGTRNTQVVATLLSRQSASMTAQ